MAKKSKYQSLTDAVVRIITKERAEKIAQLEKEYFEQCLLYSEELEAFDRAMGLFSIIVDEINSAKTQWINSMKKNYIKTLDLKSYLTFEEESIIEGKIALFTDVQLSNLTIEELASLVRE